MYRVGFAVSFVAMLLFGTRFMTVPTSAYQLPTYTPVPTLTDEELNAQKERYFTEIEDEVGFNHPIFEQIVEFNLSVKNCSLFPPVIVASTRLDTANSQYVAVVATVMLGCTPFEEFLLFQIDNDFPVLRLFEEDVDQFVNWNFENAPSGFADRNANGLPDIAVNFANTGNCCPPKLKIYEIGNEILEIAPKSDEVWVTGFDDVDSDAILEIYGSRKSCLPHYDCREYPLYRWYRWDGTAYVDITASRTDIYNPIIENALLAGETHGRCYAPYNEMQSDPGRIYPALMGYYALGHLLEGWADLYQAFWGNCSPEQLVEVDDVISEIAAWVEAVSRNNSIHVP